MLFLSLSAYCQDTTQLKARPKVGLVLSGGSAQLRGLDKLLAAQTGLPVTLAEDPLSAVAEGTGVVMNELDFLAGSKREI